MQNLTLLIADDEHSVRNGIKDLLCWSSLGIEVIGTASNGVVAQKMIQAHDPDIVLTDIKMPLMSGLELIQWSYENKRKQQYIILTGYADFPLVQKALQYKVESYLLKPVSQKELENTVVTLRDKIREYQVRHLQFAKNMHLSLKSNHIIKEHIYSNLLHGTYISEDDFFKALEDGGISTPKKPPFAVILFQFALPEKQQSPTDFYKGDSNLFKSGLRSILMDLAGGQWVEFAYHSSPDILAVLYGAPEEAVEFARQCIVLVREIAHISLQAGVGNTVTQLLHSGHSYQTARLALTYSFYECNDSVYDERLYHQQPVPLSIDYKVLAESLLSDNLLGAQESLHQELNAYIEKGLPPVDYLKHQVVYLLRDVFDHCSQWLEEDFSLTKEQSSLLFDASTLTVFYQGIHQILAQLSHALEETKKNPSHAAMREAQKFIEENITTGVTLADAAEHVYLSQSHFSALFRQEMDMTFRQYVLDLKVERAKQMLLQNQYTIAEISYLLDYKNYRGFSRAFKRETGMTPGEYQTSVKDNQAL